MNYTIGNWSVTDLVTDSATTKTKTVEVPNLTWADYARTQDEPTEAIVANTTCSEVLTPETVRFACSDVGNIYDKTSIDPTQRAPIKSGVQVMAEVKFNLRAVNGVNGQELDIPFKGRLVLVIPKFQAITSTAIDYALKRTIACCFDSDGSVDASRIIELSRGSLLPE